MAEPPGLRTFVDTNVVVYALAGGGEPRAALATAILEDGPTISVQVLNEIADVATRNLRFTPQEVSRAVASRLAFRPGSRPITPATDEAAVSLIGRHDFALHDAVLVASAPEAGCTNFLSEDMQDGLLVARTLAIQNPFRPAVLS